jgi:DNA-binding response OmpR family regulator
MKLLCLSSNEILTERIDHEAKRLSWNTKMVGDRSLLHEALHAYDPDLLLVDIDGMADLSWWEGAQPAGNIPVIFLNQELSEEFLARALDLGADAFLPKPLFSARHFEARIKSLWRRQSYHSKRFFERHNLWIDSERHRAEIAGQIIALTLTEFKILRELASEEDKVVTRMEIQTRVFGEAQVSTRSLDVHVCALRKKLKAGGLDVDSVRGVGYRLTPCPT